VTLIPCAACDGHGLVERPEPPDACPTCQSPDTDLFPIRLWDMSWRCTDPWHREKR